jgi:manganese/zinc/iron transport system substrate-binding protein
MKYNIWHYGSGILALTVVMGMTLCGCSDQDSAGASQAQSQKLRVGCTTNIVKDLVQQIGGEHVEVTAIMDGPAVDPHLYTPSPQDINALTNSDVVVYSGLHLEAQLEGALESLENRGIPAIRLSQILEEDFDDCLLHAEGAVDPHVWFDLELWGECGGWLAAELSRIDETHSADYEVAGAEFLKLMLTTQKDGKTIVANIPRERRILVTAHDAFQYFARAFDFRVEAVQGLSTASEPGLKRINELATLLVDSKISAIFTEQSVSDRNIQALISECESREHQLTIGGTLYSDTAGAAGTPEETLAGAVLHNIREMAKGLIPETASQEQP